MTEKMEAFNPKVELEKSARDVQSVIRKNQQQNKRRSNDLLSP